MSMLHNDEKKVEINAAKNYVDCHTFAEEGKKTQFYYYFGQAKSEVKILKRPGNFHIAYQRNRVTGEITAAPIAATFDGADALVLALPVTTNNPVPKKVLGTVSAFL